MGIFFSPTPVLDRLYLGSLDDAEALSSANPHQIVTVINLCHEPVVQRVPGIRYLHFPLRDARPISIAWLNAILKPTKVADRDPFRSGSV